MGDLIILSLVFIISILPVFTIGAGLTALYYVVVKNVRHDRSNLTEAYIKSFKENFKQGTIIGLISLVIKLLLIYNILLIGSVDLFNLKELNLLQTFKGNGFVYLYLALFILSMCMSLYVYPLLSRYNMSVKNVFSMAFYCVFRHLLTTVSCLIVLCVGLFIAHTSLFMGIMLVPSVTTLIISMNMEKVLYQYIPEQYKNMTDKLDTWYLE